MLLISSQEFTIGTIEDNHLSQFATLLGAIPYFTAGAVLVSSMAWLEGKQFSKFEDDYLESGSNRGITMEIWHWDMGNGFPVTTYSVFEN